jgi:glycosyltransferase involved in cell wall biosynthesis
MNFANITSYDAAGSFRPREEGCLDANRDDANCPPDVKELTAAIVICTRYRSADLRSCLSAIVMLRRAPDEIIIVDNTSGDIPTKEVAQEFGARYLLEPTTGLSRARNVGLAAAKSDIVAYIDDDARPHEEWLGILLRTFADPKVGVATGDTYPSLDAIKAPKDSSIHALSNEDPQWLETAAFGGLGIGTNMALRKCLCEGWDVFDERLGRGAPLEGMEEHHAFVGILSRGYSAAHVSHAIVIHSSQYSLDVMRETRNTFAYWLLLFAENPGRRRELVRFLIQRIRRKPLDWKIEWRESGRIVSRGRFSLLKAGIAGSLLYLHCRKLGNRSGTND